MKQYISLLLLLAFTNAVWAKKDIFPTMFAHRGAHTTIIPENSLAAVASAKRFGYTGIECDVHYTADSVMVILHDATLNRTARHAKDYSPLKEKVYLSKLTFEELRRNYVLASDNPALRTPIPTLEELLAECKKYGIIPMLHSDILASFYMAQEILGDNWICFGASRKNMQEVRKFSNCLILAGINSGTAEQHINTLNSIGGRCGVSTMKQSLLSEEFCKTLKQAGYDVQASIFPAPYEAQAQRNGITYQLTDFSLMPNKMFKPYDRWIQKNKTITVSQNIEKAWTDSLEYGGITLGIEFKGEIEVIINNKHRYILTQQKKSTDYIGYRFNNNIPSIKIRALEKTEIKKIEVNIYKF